MVTKSLPVGIPIIDDFDRLDFSKILKVIFESLFIGIPRPTDEQLAIFFVTHGCCYG